MSTAVGPDAAPTRPPPPWRNPRFHRRSPVRPNRGEGTFTDCLGRRAIVGPIDWLATWREALEQQAGDAADEILTAAGAAWGAEDMAGFIARAADEFGDELAKVHMGVALQTWWWPFRAGGWGCARFDYGRPAQRAIRVELSESATARAAGSGSRPVCHLYSGLYAGALSRLVGRTLVGVEVRCHARDGGDCRFLVTTEARAASLREWLRSGVPADELESRLAGPKR